MWESAQALRRNTDFWQKPSARDTALILMCFTAYPTEPTKQNLLTMNLIRQMYLRSIPIPSCVKTVNIICIPMETKSILLENSQSTCSKI